MNVKQWFAPGRSASLLVGLALCSLLLAQGVKNEVALGGLSGRAVMRENGRPIAGALVTVRPVDYEAEGARDRVLVTDKNGEFKLRHLPEGSYWVEASAKAHEMGPVATGVVGGKSEDVQLDMEPKEPYLDVYVPQKVFMPEEKPGLKLEGFGDPSDLEITLYKLNFDKVLAKGSMQQALGSLATQRWQENAPASPTTLGKKVKTLNRKITNRDAEGIFVESMDLDPQPEGLYWIQCKVGGLVKGSYINVTRIALVTKSVDRNVTCYVTEIGSGKPVAGAKVGYGTPKGYVAAGVTDASGLAQFSVPQNDGNAAVLASHGVSRALTDFYIYGRPGVSARIFTYTDRPVYRPGDEVRFKGIVRQSAGIDYVVPKPGPVAVEVRDQDDSLHQTLNLQLSATGTFHGKFQFNKEAAPGAYNLNVSWNGEEETHYVTVASYRKPDFTVKVDPNEKFYVRGDRAKATVKCEYYFGGPVVGAEVSVYVNRQPYWSWWGEGEEEEEGEEAYDYGYGGGEESDEIKATTDENGEAVIEFDTKLPEDPAETTSDYIYTVTASVKDPSGKYFDGTGQVKVVRGEVDLGILPDTFMVDQGQAAKVTIKGKNQRDGKPAAGLRVTLNSGTEVWSKGGSNLVDEKTQEVTLGPDGTAQVEIMPSRSGGLKITAQAGDVVDEQHIYVAGEDGYSAGPKPPKLKITLDKRRYDVGDTAKAMVETDSPGGSALITVEGEKLYSARTVALTDNVTVISIPVTREFAPNAWVGATYVKNKKFAESTKALLVELGERKLDITVKSDKDVYQPGETARYTIHTSAAGKGVPAEVSLGVVDEAIYAIREDQTDIVSGFFPRRENRISTNYSFPELYLDGGDKAPASIRVRTEFKDTAYWNPTIATDAQGNATVEVPLPDNLTQWRATVVGVTDQTRVGSAIQKVVARKPLMVRLSAPAFMVQSDRQQLVAMIKNDTGADADVHLQVTAQGVDLDGDLNRTIRIDNGSQESVTWDVAVRESGTASFVAKVWTDDNQSDGVELKVQVKPHGRTIVTQEAGDLKDSAAFKMTLYDLADRKNGSLRVSLTPGVSSAIVESLDGLIDFPYGCTEQTMSRFMPTIVATQTMKLLNLPPPARAAKIPAMVADGFTRLRTMQHGDGGWGWWENDNSDLHMTAYVLEGYSIAAKAGYEPNQFSLENGLRWAKARATEAAKLDRREIPYLAYALALHGKTDQAAMALGAIKFDPRKAGACETAEALMAYSLMGPAYEQRKRECLNAVIGKARGSGGIRYWTDEDRWGVESTARCLQAVASVAPDHPILAQAARYMMVARKGDAWTSTRDTAYAIIGLSRIIRNMPPAKPGSTVVLKINGQEAARIVLTAAALKNPGLKFELPIDKLTSGENRLELTQTMPGGTPGTLYYSAELNQIEVRDRLGEVLAGSGLKVERAYYKMESRRQEDGTIKLVPSPQPVEEAETGDILQCVLTVTSDRERQYMMIEDPIPAGCRITERATTEYDWEWDYWYCGIVIRDDRAAFFARDLTSGKNEITYMLRVETPGRSHALPTTVYNMYDPMNRASCGEDVLEVGR